MTVTKKVAFVELRTHNRAPRAPDDPACELREMFYHYLDQKGEAQRQERAPAPSTRTLRAALADLGFGPKGKGKGAK